MEEHDWVSNTASPFMPSWIQPLQCTHWFTHTHMLYVALMCVRLIQLFTREKTWICIIHEGSLYSCMPSRSTTHAVMSRNVLHKKKCVFQKQITFWFACHTHTPAYIKFWIYTFVYSIYRFIHQHHHHHVLHTFFYSYHKKNMF